MKKTILPLAFAALSVFESEAQCTVEAFPTDTVVLTCGETLDLELSAFGLSGNFAINNDFNAGNAGQGWDGTLAATYTNPCVDSPDGSIYMWMGDATPQPRILTTQAFDLSTGGTICYEMRYAVQAEAAPCEGPDEPQEGVYLQYSIDNGANWVTIDYIDPIGGYDPVITSWQQYCYGIPPAAQTTNTKIRWFQDATSGAEYDHWGLDNVFISINDPSYSYLWEHNGYTGPEPPMVTVDGDSIFVVNYGNGVDDFCSDTVYIQTVPPVFFVSTVPDTSICGDGCIDLNGVANVLVRPESSPTFENNEFQPLVPLGQQTVISVAVGGVPMQTVGAGTIESVCLNLNNPALPFPINMGTFTITLECPGGASVTLIDQGSVSGTSLSNTCFSDSGLPLSSGTAPYSGTFQPASGSMSDLIGCSTYGVWTVTIVNSDFLAFGFFNSWAITFNVPEISYPGVFEWSPSTGLDDPTSLDPMACPQTSTTYELMVTDSFECATTVHEVTIGIIDPNQLAVQAEVTDANCAANDGAINLTVIGASGNETVEWQDGTMGTVLTNVDSGLYQVTVVDGCVLDTLISVGTIPSDLSVEATVTDADCGSANGAIEITVIGSSGNETIEWEDGTMGSVLVDVTTGTYGVTVSDGCVLDTMISVGALGGPIIDSLAVEPPLPGSTDGEIEILATGGTAPLQYSLNGGDFQAVNIFSALDTGSYYIVVQDAFGCEDTVTISMDDFIEVTIPSIFNPNSSTERNRTFVILGMNEPELLVYNRWGFKIYESDAYQNDWDGDKCADGVYYYIAKNRA
ncbi:MAG: gliding motility-associated C-terminal domain-containing protein, partial [Flavobacteriales bacterium]|nr:gliding motility-associated C-terminal domain-containing protein [Flavobacteriales bacterium]